MRRPVNVRLKVDRDLRQRFNEAAYRSHHYPSQVLRLLMEKYVEFEYDPYAYDLTLWSNSVSHAAVAAGHELPPRR